MKKFRDLNVGETIFIGFEKKFIKKIRKDFPLKDDVTIYTDDGEDYTIRNYVAFDYCYEKATMVYSEKEAIIEFYKDKLIDLKRDYDNRKARLDNMLEIAKKL